MREIEKITDIIKENIVAILPDYEAGLGNCTLVWNDKGEEILYKKSIKTAIRHMCNYYHLDLKASNKTYGELLSIRKFPPIPFTKDDIFISVKTRFPIGRDDGAHGYIRLDAIDKVKMFPDKDSSVSIDFKNGKRIRAYSRLETIRKSINNGEIVKRLLEDTNPLLAKENPGIYLEENSPATKKDIAMVYMKLMEIRDRL